ncbi:alpha/beta hydrolase [Flavilitoribacter nigricans]|uniref:Serine aminopeptidase S33 domain-containing protein n=1 Tax=Flavilitoribacter nigricans (strain ATCC 23147 / DSM 23189 / NBRC 102662 / NCIMB 1420 / SS-2) TaxID=1122177 RepID=A0A2D0NEY3_FLAN2|nr:alpha/beta hydrolase [Flavilitoribacter nigricans]PHN07071.1 hypothetical protein CRP01_07515 [Flavilitoribacter nigricans DSM 23189 = NBRC 102662]
MILPTVYRQARPIGLLLTLAGTTVLEPAAFGPLTLQVLQATLGIGLFLLAISCLRSGHRPKLSGLLFGSLLLCSFTVFRGNAQSGGVESSATVTPVPAYAQKMVRSPQPGALAEFFSYETITFRSKDGLSVTGNLYEVGPANPIILLCHQANYNKYEYADIAPRLNGLGYNVLAIDQRSGGTFAGNSNETLQTARAAGIQHPDFLDAEQDIVAAVEFLAARYQRQVIVWGSSYSSALALFVAVHPDVKAALAFSPGNYFRDQKPDLKIFMHKLKKPVFITSSREEAEELEHTVGRSLDGQVQIQFIPESGGYHGSKALWEGQEGAEEYWGAVLNFLLMIQ